MTPLRRPLALLGLLALAAAPAWPAADSVSYYHGQAAYFSLDGRIPYHKTELALKREVLRDGALIRETVTRPGLAPGMPPELSVLELRRRGDSLVFDASGPFTGTVAFSDKRLKEWTLDLHSQSGRDLTGSAKISSAGLKARKFISGPGRSMSVREDLKAVSPDGYQARLREMKPLPGTE
ncbi:MAG: hypothetical protein HY926_04075 [Elusimicrobia bacterium]|nr:hypothetical protein [Elusimicrobiota bacterium]